MSYNARKELLLSFALRYHKANRSAKGKILDEFTAATGYHRKYAILMLRQFKAPVIRHEPAKKPSRRTFYNEEVQKALIQLWETANRICSKRLAGYWIFRTILTPLNPERNSQFHDCHSGVY